MLSATSASASTAYDVNTTASLLAGRCWTFAAMREIQHHGHDPYGGCQLSDAGTLLDKLPIDE